NGLELRSSAFDRHYRGVFMITVTEIATDELDYPKSGDKLFNAEAPSRRESQARRWGAVRLTFRRLISRCLCASALKSLFRVSDGLRTLASAALIALASAGLYAADVDPYRQAGPGYRYLFPRDHFEHPDFRTEWWYYTGNLRDSAGRRFGFELVFFRQGERPGPAGNQSSWRIDDLYLAHLAITDISGKRFYNYRRLNRAGPGI